MDGSEDIATGRSTGASEQAPARRHKARKAAATDIAQGLFETGRRGGLHERIYRSLVHAIVSGRFASGGRLPSEPELAAAFAVSRPVLRQALERLRVEGLIQSLRGSGNYVARIDEFLAPALLSRSDPQALTRHMTDDLEFRLVIEPEAAFLAAQRRTGGDMQLIEAALSKFEEAHAAGANTHHFDFLFHEAIAAATANERFVDSVRSLEYGPDEESISLRHLIHFQPVARGATVLKEHAAVLELIRLRQADAARQAMWNHIEAARHRLLDHLKTSLGRSQPSAAAGETR